MGGFLSSFAQPEVPPSVVLVPPLIDSRDRGRSRFAKSSYDRLFGQPQLRALFDDYLHGEARGALRFTPPEDPRISVAAKLGLPRPPTPAQPAGMRGAVAAPVENPPSGSVTLRYQPDPTVPWTFLDVKAGSKGAAGSAALRACVFDPATRLAVFGHLPLTAAQGPGGGGSNMRLGLRYTSPQLSSGAILSPARGGVLHSAWAVGRVGGLTWGVQTSPDAALAPLFGGPSEGRAAAWRQAAVECRGGTSWAVAYQPEGQSAYGKGVFTAAVELRSRNELAVSFLHHMAVQRNVRNPFEASDVVGITNYIDVGFQMVTNLAPAGGGGAGSGDGGNGMRLAAAWQANKNVAVKGRVGLDGVAAGVLLKSWWQPSFALGLAVVNDCRGGPTRVGLTADVGTYKTLRYERSAEGQKMSGARVTQRHVAGPEDVAYHEGRGLLVPLDQVDDARVLGRGRPAGDDYL